jgi:hypothetical protein
MKLSVELITTIALGIFGAVFIIITSVFGTALTYLMGRFFVSYLGW